METRNLLKHRHRLLREAEAVAALATSRSEALDCDGAFPDLEVRELHRRGLLHAPFPAHLDGDDLGSPPGDPLLLADVLACVGAGNLALGRLYEGHVNAVKLVRLYGSQSNVALLKAEADAGRLTGVWMAEDARTLLLEEEGGERRLSGCKILASGAGHIRRALVAAKTAEGSLLLVPRVPAGADLSGWTPAGMRASATGAVDFTGVPVEPDEIVGRPGDYLRSPYFRGGAWRVMAVQVGGLRALLESYRAQIVGPGRDGDRMQRARFAEAAAAAETARLWVNEAARLAEDADADPARVDAYVDLMRGTFEQAALLVVEHAGKSLGLKAFMRPNPAERIIRDLTTYLRQPGLDGSAESAAAFFFHQSPATETESAAT